MEQADTDLDTLDRAIGERVRALRAARDLTLEALAEKAGVSRAMLSRIERGELNPTAQLLGRVCAGLDVTLSTLFAETEHAPSPLSRHGAQMVWRDPGSGYVRRVVTPPNCGAAADIVDVEFPAGASVTMELSPTPPMDQQIVLLAGRMELTVGETTLPARSRRLSAHASWPADRLPQSGQQARALSRRGRARRAAFLKGRSMADTIVIRELDAAEAERRLGELGVILRDAVENGASVNFLPGFTQEEAEEFWRGQLARHRRWRPASAGGR